MQRDELPFLPPKGGFVNNLKKYTLKELQQFCISISKDSKGTKQKLVEELDLWVELFAVSSSNSESEDTPMTTACPTLSTGAEPPDPSQLDLQPAPSQELAIVANGPLGDASGSGVVPRNVGDSGAPLTVHPVAEGSPDRLAVISTTVPSVHEKSISVVTGLPSRTHDPDPEADSPLSGCLPTKYRRVDPAVSCQAPEEPAAPSLTLPAYAADAPVASAKEWASLDSDVLSRVCAHHGIPASARFTKAQKASALVHYGVPAFVLEHARRSPPPLLSQHDRDFLQHLRKTSDPVVPVARTDGPNPFQNGGTQSPAGTAQPAQPKQNNLSKPTFAAIVRGVPNAQSNGVSAEDTKKFSRMLSRAINTLGDVLTAAQETYTDPAAAAKRLSSLPALCRPIHAELTSAKTGFDAAITLGAQTHPSRPPPTPAPPQTPVPVRSTPRNTRTTDPKHAAVWSAVRCVVMNPREDSLRRVPTHVIHFGQRVEIAVRSTLKLTSSESPVEIVRRTARGGYCV